MKEKIIFLDIDGVLNNKNDGSSYYCMNPSMYGFSNENLNNLKSILSSTNAKIVFSTSWRNHEDDFEYCYNGINFKSPLKKITESLKTHLHSQWKCPHFHRMLKKDDILGWFYQMKHIENKDIFDDYNFVILDDVRNQGLDFFGKSFFCIDIDKGLTKNDAEAVSLFLNYEE